MTSIVDPATASTPGGADWRTAERDRLLDFAEASRLEIGGFGWLDGAGRVEADRPRELWITARMTHCFALAALEGRAGATELAAHGIAALRGPFCDTEHGGWFRTVGADSDVPVDAAKDCYDHAFVMLAASSGVQAEVPGAEELLAEATAIVLEHFWDADAGRMHEHFDRDWSVEEAYRGANSNMHSVEASLAVAAATEDPAWTERALSIATHVIEQDARSHGWRLVEHYDPSWTPRPEYNADAPGDPFRPYGTTIGHWLEWSRLLIGLAAALEEPPAWLVEAATALVDESVRVGWHADGTDGFVYTLDWNDRPVVRERMHWVVCEAILAADALGRWLDEARYLELAAQWWQHAQDHFVDRTGGSWHHELDPTLAPSHTVWSGKPDVYHAVQATLLPDLPPGAAAAAALRAR